MKTKIRIPTSITPKEPTIDSLAFQPTKSPGGVTNRSGRYEKHGIAAKGNGWTQAKRTLSPPKSQTNLTKDKTKTIISPNFFPDVPFDRSINPYRGCELGCIYCFARPTHAYLGLSPGLDFSTKIFYKPEAARLLERELRKPNYQCRTLALGTNTDPYQPVEKTLRLTRSILEVLLAFRHPVSIVTKSALIIRDLDILKPMAEKGLVEVSLSIATLDHRLTNTLEPLASTPMKRLGAIRTLGDAGIPCGIIAAPIIPALNDHELESILEGGRDTGATLASYILMRVPLQVSDLFKEWLETYEPNKAKQVMNLLAEIRDAKDCQKELVSRLKSTGGYKALLAKRFELIIKRLGYEGQSYELDINQFTIPVQQDKQLALF
jgi:DNA repair photolyase